MTVDVTYVELKNFPKYVSQIDVFGVPCLLTASYNSRKGQRLISLTSYDGEIVYLKPTFITNFDRVFLNFNMLLNELNVYVTLQALTVNGVKQTSTNYLNWSNSYRLAFVSLPPVERFVGFKNLNDEEVFEEPDFEEYEWAVTSVEYLTEGSYQTARYSGTRIIEDKNYSSYADIDLTQHLVRSFYDADLQTYAAFTTAVEQLVGAVDWVLDPEKNSIEYVQNDSDPKSPQYQYYWQYGDFVARSADELHQMRFNAYKGDSPSDWESIGSCYIYDHKAQCPRNIVGYGADTVEYTARLNSAYDPDYNNEKKTLPLETVAQQVISNAESSGDEVLKLLSEDYINLTAESIFNTDTAKQFVKLEDLIPQFEMNKVLVQ